MKIAIFNGLPFHFEMFGYILHFCKSNGHDLTIYSVDDSHGWKEFYCEMYPGVTWKHPRYFGSDYKNYKYIVLTTDDDGSFSDIFTRNKNVICIDHHYTIRRTSIDRFFHIATRPFSMNYRKWGLPCYPIIQTVSEKARIFLDLQEQDCVHVAIIGGRNDYEVKQIHRLSSSSKICLHILSRTVRADLLESLNTKFTLQIHENVSTKEMLDILKISKYLICDVTTNVDHINGKSMSGGIPLAFSNLNTLILSSINNELYKFKSAQTFDLNSNEPIEITSKVDMVDIQKIYQERNALIQEFHIHMNELVNN